MRCQQRNTAPSSLSGDDGRHPVETTFLPSASAAWHLQQGRAALALLLEAVGYARELNRPRWDFAVEIAALHETGLTASALRWLVCKGYAEHAFELTTQGHAARSFRRSQGLRFGRRTCFVLTDAGLAFAREVLAGSLPGHLQESASVAGNGGPSEGNGEGTAPVLRPIWDGQRRELRVGGALVKHFKVPAANQQAILAAFEEEGWPPRVDDPLSPHPEQDPKRRLHDTINSLNRNQRHPLLRFMGDGSGEGVCWSPLSPGDNGGARIDPG